MLFSDVDGTLLDPHGVAENNAAALVELGRELRAAGVVLVLNSSRPVVSIIRSLAEEPELPLPDYVVGAMGTQIAGHDGWPLEDYGHDLAGDWSRRPYDRLAEELGWRPHAEEFQTPLKASFDAPKDADEAYFANARRRAEAIGPVKMVVSTGQPQKGPDVDFLPPAAGKRTAVEWLARRVGVDLVVVSGDSGNDAEMFGSPHKGVVVANAEPALRRAVPADAWTHHAQATVAAGVAEGLRKFGVL